MPGRRRHSRCCQCRCPHPPVRHRQILLHRSHPSLRHLLIRHPSMRSPRIRRRWELHHHPSCYRRRGRRPALLCRWRPHRQGASCRRPSICPRTRRRLHSRCSAPSRSGCSLCRSCRALGSCRQQAERRDAANKSRRFKASLPNLGPRIGPRSISNTPHQSPRQSLARAQAKRSRVESRATMALLREPRHAVKRFDALVISGVPLAFAIGFGLHLRRGRATRSLALP
jgi:hypothetical protein